MSFKSSILSLIAFSSVATSYAQDTVQLSSVELAPVLMEGITNPRAYMGFKGKSESLPSDWACDDRRRFWSINWRAELEDVDVKFDPANPDFTEVKVVLKNSSVRAMYYKSDGIFCLWSGGEGEISAGRITVKFSLKVMPNSDFPEISLNALDISRIGIRDIDVLYRTFFSTGFKEASDGFAEYVENNFNGLIRVFLNTGLKKAINKAINKEVDRRLKEREDGSPLITP